MRRNFSLALYSVTFLNTFVYSHLDECRDDRMGGSLEQQDNPRPRPAALESRPGQAFRIPARVQTGKSTMETAIRTNREIEWCDRMHTALVEEKCTLSLFYSHSCGDLPVD